MLGLFAPADENGLSNTLKRRIIGGILAFFAYTFIGVVFAIRWYLFSLADDKVDFTFEIGAWVVIGWWMWVLLTPIVLFLSRRFPIERKNLSRHLFVHFLGWIFVSFSDVSIYHILRIQWGPLAFAPASVAWNELQTSFIASYALDLLVYASIVAVAHAYETQRMLQEREIRTTQLQAQLAKARLQALEMQLHPHFLFNTLNAISALMEEDVHASRNMITLLSELLRITLDNPDDNEVTVRKEIGFIERYLEIQEIRFRGRLEASIEVDPEAWDALVPHLILQPLVENAVKHGAPIDDIAGKVRIRVFRDQGALVLTVSDNGPGLPGQSNGTGIKEGIGLRNTRERLKQFYESAHQFSFDRAEEGGLKVTVSLPFYKETDKLEVVE